MKNRSEIARATIENSAMKCCGYLLKNRNEIPGPQLKILQ